MRKKPQCEKLLASIMYHVQLCRCGASMVPQQKRKNAPPEVVDDAWATPMKLMRNFYSGYSDSRRKGLQWLGMQSRLKPGCLFVTSVLSLKHPVGGWRSFLQGTAWQSQQRCHHRTQAVCNSNSCWSLEFIKFGFTVNLYHTWLCIFF